MILATTYHGLRSKRWLCSRSIPRQWFDLLHRWRRKQNRRDSTSWLCFSWISIRWMRLLPILSNFKHFCLSFFLPSNIFQSIISFLWFIFMIHFEFIHKNILFVQNVKKGILYTCIFWGLYGIFTKSFRFPFDIQADMLLGQHCNLNQF